VLVSEAEGGQGDEYLNLRNNMCRPSGTCSFTPRFPALKRWANMFRPSGAGSSAD
jgi:hypothetical protein